MAARVSEYGTPTAPLGKLVGVVMLRLDEMVIANCLVAEADPLSRTCTVNVKAPDAVGVPPITPLEAPSDMPAGSAP